MNAIIFPRTIIISNQWANSLHDTTACQIQEGLQFVISPQHQHIALRELCQNTIQCRDQKGRQRHIQDGWNADRVKPSADTSFKANSGNTDLYRNRFYHIDNNINYKCNHLSGSGRQCCPFNTHGRERAKTEDQNRIQNNIGNTSGHHAEHGYFHPAHCLERFLKRKATGNDHSKEKSNSGIADSIINDCCITGKQGQEFGHDQNTDDR